MPVFQLSDDLIFPPIHLAEEDGLLAVGGDLTMDRMLLAYSLGIFPWYDDDSPILWFSPDPRMVIRPEEFVPARSLLRSEKKHGYTHTMDSAFEDVISRCADVPRPGQEGTWITDDLKQTSIDLHHAGYAHSVETWQDGELVGGLYGLSLGGCFFGDSMFSTQTDASKSAFHGLARALTAWDFSLIDCQLHNPHLESLGAYTIPRTEFATLLQSGLQKSTKKGPWTADFIQISG